MYGGVGGACMLISLNNFPARQELSLLKGMSQDNVKVMEFYMNMAHNWNWIRRLELQLSRGIYVQPTACREVKMSGVRTPVYGQEMPLKKSRIEVETYRWRAESGYGFHNDSFYMDSWVNRSKR